jgi:hypothetical protein
LDPRLRSAPELSTWYTASVTSQLAAGLLALAKERYPLDRS